MAGRIINSHHARLCTRLLLEGYRVSRQTSVGDDPDYIKEALTNPIKDADLLIVTGGLGPTKDDMTVKAVSEQFGIPLTHSAEVEENVRKLFEIRGRPMPSRGLLQARVPEGAVIFQNRNGTAPGLAVEVRRHGEDSRPHSCWIVMLPGPPRELNPMFDNQVMPFIKERFPQDGQIHTRLIKITGPGESQVEESVAPALAPFKHKGVEVGICARPGEVEISLQCAGKDSEIFVNEAATTIKSIMGDTVFALDTATMESEIVRMLSEKKLSLALAESCTGGLIGHRLTNISGASSVLKAGLVVYSNEAKIEFLDVAPEIIEAHGAVSAETAEAMAVGTRKRTGADYAISVTGIAGPTGGTADKPVGTVFMAVASESGVTVRKRLNMYDRETFKLVTSQQALNMLRRVIGKREQTMKD
ncbi:MAG: CinA family nicotinamide mononucleotide deamidase-related protein [Verrucomicrobia bacterium]|nr:CinA family nicotinamide mononucleotide deamidase-related protein [Verrucomicrobiota bacterium]